MKSWCLLKFKRKKKTVYYIEFIALWSKLPRENEFWLELYVFYFPSHAMQQTQKMFRLSSYWTNFFIYHTFAQKKVNHVFKVMLPTVKFVPLPFLKNAYCRKASARLIVNSENNYPDTNSCLRKRNAWKGLSFNAHLYALTVLMNLTEFKYNYHIWSVFKKKTSHSDSILSSIEKQLNDE